MAEAVFEAIGIPATIDICQDIVKAGGNIANIGVHGKPVNFKLDEMLEAYEVFGNAAKEKVLKVILSAE
jgi:alcohol dehydrogenase